MKNDNIIQPSGPQISKWLPIFILGVLCYLWFFFSGNIEGKVSRTVVLLIPFEPKVMFSCLTEGTFGFERLSVIAIALIGLLSSHGFGRLVLRLFPVDSLNGLERSVFASGIGLNLCSSGILVLGLFGLADNSFLIRSITLAGLAVLLVLLFLERKDFAFSLRKERDFSFLWFLLPVVPGLLILLGGTQPPSEYDVVSYHLEGAKEIYQSGHVAFAPHNVYINMPLGAEMYAVWGMAFTGNWWFGGLIGKTLIATCSIITAFAVYAAGKRFASGLVGIIGMILYLSCPWTFQQPALGLVDGVLGMYLFLAVYAMILCDGKTNGLLLCGYLAGSAAACKYPAMLFVVFPLGGWIVIERIARTYRSLQKFDYRTTGIKLGCFLLAAGLACGLWYAKNAWFTGNPTYPLLYNVFGDSSGTWNRAKNDRWTRAHSPHDYSPNALFESAEQIAIKSSYQSPLIFPLAVCAVFTFGITYFRYKQKQEDLPGWFKPFCGFVVFSIFMLSCWWFFTHRIDRFWVPLIPVFAWIAAIGVSRCTDTAWRITLSVFLIFGIFYQLILGTCLISPGILENTEVLRTGLYAGSSWEKWYNEFPPEGKILLIGEAKAYNFEPPVVYNTCFDDTLFDSILKDKTPEEARKALEEAGISDVLVHWGELGRFRSPGNYGYTSNFVQPEVFEELVKHGVLVPFEHEREPERSIQVFQVKGKK